MKALFAILAPGSIHQGYWLPEENTGMNGVRLNLRVPLGGAVCGSFLGIFAGGLLGGFCGILTGSLSLGLDSALVGGGVGCLGGAVYGVYLAVKEGKAETGAASGGRPQACTDGSPQRQAGPGVGTETSEREQ